MYRLIVTYLAVFVLAIVWLIKDAFPVVVAQPAEDLIEYVVEGGSYAIRLPADAKVHKNERPSVDGVTIAMTNTLAVQSATYTLSITHFEIPAGTPLHRFVATQSDCVDVRADNGTFMTIGGTYLLSYIDTHCGPAGTSYFYTVTHLRGYRIAVEFNGPFAQIKGQVDEHISNFTIIPPEDKWKYVQPSEQRVIVRATATPRPPDDGSLCELPSPIELAMDENRYATLADMMHTVNIQWMILSSMHHVDILPVQESEALGLPLLLVKWSSPQIPQTTLSFFWKDQDTWQEQTYCMAEQNLVEARLASTADGLTVAVIVDTCVGTTSSCHHVRLYQLEEDGWIEGWNTQGVDDWPSAHVSVQFPVSGRDTLLVRSSSWHNQNTDPVESAKRQIFREANAGPHRWFNDIWQRSDEGYMHLARFAEPSAYHTLIEFLHALQNGLDTRAWAVSDWVVREAMDFGVDKLPEQLIPILPDGKESIQQGPISVATDTQALIFHFIQRNGRFLVSNIDLLGDESVTPSSPSSPVSGAIAPHVHVVREGETVLSIAALYEVPVFAIREANQMSADEGLQIGQEVVIPFAARGPSPTATPTFAPFSGTPQRNISTAQRLRT